MRRFDSAVEAVVRQPGQLILGAGPAVDPDTVLRGSEHGDRLVAEGTERLGLLEEVGDAETSSRKLRYDRVPEVTAATLAASAASRWEVGGTGVPPPSGSGRKERVGTAKTISYWTGYAGYG